MKTSHNPVEAARVHDVAAKWIHGPNARLNFPDVHAPAPITEAEIAGRLIDAGLPMKLLVNRVPLHMLKAAGVSQSEMFAAGVSLERLAQVFSPHALA